MPAPYFTNLASLPRLAERVACCVMFLAAAAACTCLAALVDACIAALCAAPAAAACAKGLTV